METTRRYLVLTPVAFGVTAVAALAYLLDIDGLGEPADFGMALLFALITTVAALLLVLLAGGLLRLLGVSNAWATLGLAAGLLVVVYAIGFVGAAPWRFDEAEWGLLVFTAFAVGVLPSLLTYAVGLLIRGGRGVRRSRTTEA